MTDFDAAAFQAALTTRWLGRFLVYRESVDTTMRLARREAEEGAPDGTLVLAEEQTAGHGRRGRAFYSPSHANLYFTLLLRRPAAVHAGLPLSVPLAVCTAVRGQGVDGRIKWPNDIWVGRRKLAGMLIDAEADASGLVALPGIGINVNGDPTLEPHLRDIATSIRRERGEAVLRETLLAGVCNALEAALALDRAELLAQYRALSMVVGSDVTVIPSAGAAFEGHAMAIGDDGALVVVDRAGSRHEVTAADVSVRPRTLES